MFGRTVARCVLSVVALGPRARAPMALATRLAPRAGTACVPAGLRACSSEGQASEDETPVTDSDTAAQFKKIFTESPGTVSRAIGRLLAHGSVPTRTFPWCCASGREAAVHEVGGVTYVQLAHAAPHHICAKHVVTAAEMEKVMNSLKIGPDTYVFAYDSDNGLFASRFVWTCWFYGHQHAYMPTGGWKEWLRRQQPLGCGSQSIEAHAAEKAPRPWRAKEVQNHIAVADDLDDPMVQVLDVRSADEFSGADLRGNPRGGHVPGARNLDWRLFMDRTHPEFTKSPEECEELLAGIGGLSRDRPVVLVCQSGTRSAFAAVALADLGYHIANYDGGMAEWLADPSREVETGDGRA